MRNTGNADGSVVISPPMIPEHLYRILFDNAPDGIFLSDADGRYVAVNQQGARLTGYSREEILNLYTTDLVPLQERDRMPEPMAGAYRDNIEQTRRRILCKDGRSVPVDITIRRLPDGYLLESVRAIPPHSAAISFSGPQIRQTTASGTVPCRISGTPQNNRLYEVARREAAERKRTEKKLRTSEARFRQVVESSPIAIGIAALQGTIEYINPKFEELFGYPLPEISRLEDWFARAYPDPDYRERIKSRWFASLEAAARQNRPSETMDVHITCRDGSIRIMQVFGAVMGDRVLAMFNDLTAHKQAEQEKEKLQKRLQQAHKMESVGRLAGGVAHDFNNMLGVILGHTEMALEQLKPADPLFKAIEEIRKAARRSANLTRQLLAFARKQTVTPRVLDLNETVGGMLTMLRRLIGEDIDLVWIPETGLWPVKIDPGQIDQILANLCVNARDAIKTMGKITIQTANTRIDEAFCARHADMVAGAYVRLTVRDNGCGVDRAIQNKLFEPFFTTKQVGRGTGLGLATVYGIVKQNKGFINVHSELDRGTSFEIYLPRGSDQVETKGNRKPTLLSGRGDETILLVEDEPDVLNIATIMLERHGYHVITAQKPNEALRVARAHAGRIHLLMTDVVMPEMNGRVLAEQLMVLYPDMKLLFMSGYTADVIAHHGVLDHGIDFIQKPFSRQDLVAKVTEVLHRNKDYFSDVRAGGDPSSPI